MTVSDIQIELDKIEDKQTEVKVLFLYRCEQQGFAEGEGIIEEVFTDQKILYLYGADDTIFRGGRVSTILKSKVRNFSYLVGSN